MSRQRKSATDKAPVANPVKRTTIEQRGATTSIVSPAIHTISKIVELLKPWELSPSMRFKTYQLMLQSSAIWSSVESRITSIEVSQSKPKIVYDKQSPRSLWLKEFIEYNIRGMDRTTRSIGHDAAEMVYNGIAPFEVVTKIDKSTTEYNGKFVLKDLVYIDPLSLDKVKPFETKNGGRDIAYWRQLISAFADTDGTLNTPRVGSTGVVTVDAKKIAFAGYTSSNSRPLGTSPLDACYEDWRAMKLIEEYLLMGIQRDMAGIPCLSVPQDLIDKAQDTNSSAYATMMQLVEHMTNLHQGDQSFLILPSDPHEGATTMKQYDINFKGIDGASKMFDLVEIIEMKKKAIYTVLGATHLIAGENGGGSYNLLEGKANIAGFMSIRDNTVIDEIYNKTVIPMILRLNNFTNEKLSDIPVYVAPPPQPVSLEEFSKAVSRTMRLLPAKAEVGNAIMERLGIDYRLPDDVTPEGYRELLFEFSDPSKVGTSEGSSGQGGNQQFNSETNDENVG